MAKILVVDDERNVRRAFEEILAGKGHVVVAVRGAEEALAAVDREDCELAILDICLPGMSGLDALAANQRAPPQTARHRHDRPGHHQHGDRSNETGGFRLPVEAFFDRRKCCKRSPERWKRHG